LHRNHTPRTVRQTDLARDRQKPRDHRHSIAMKDVLVPLLSPSLGLYLAGKAMEMMNRALR
jgi:hypothetical protein